MLKDICALTSLVAFLTAVMLWAELGAVPFSQAVHSIVVLP